MSDSKYRIPRMTVAVMVLGAGCDDGNGEGGVSDGRLTRLASDMCNLSRTCDWEDADPHPFTSEQACVDSYVQELKAFFDELDESCGAAYLSYYECYVSLGCDPSDVESFRRCQRSYTLVEEHCEGMLYDDHVDAVED